MGIHNLYSHNRYSDHLAEVQAFKDMEKMQELKKKEQEGQDIKSTHNEYLSVYYILFRIRL